MVKERERGVRKGHQKGRNKAGSKVLAVTDKEENREGEERRLEVKERRLLTP